MHWHGLARGGIRRRNRQRSGIDHDIVLLPETKGKSLEELASEPETPAERAQEAA